MTVREACHPRITDSETLPSRCAVAGMVGGFRSVDRPANVPGTTGPLQDRAPPKYPGAETAFALPSISTSTHSPKSPTTRLRFPARTAGQHRGSVVIWLITGDLNTITESLLALLGMSTGTALGGALIDNNKTQAAATPPPAAAGAAPCPVPAPVPTSPAAPVPPAAPEVSRGFVRDILSTNAASACTDSKWPSGPWCSESSSSPPPTTACECPNSAPPSSASWASPPAPTSDSNSPSADPGTVPPPLLDRHRLLCYGLVLRGLRGPDPTPSKSHDIPHPPSALSSHPRDGCPPGTSHPRRHGPAGLDHRPRRRTALRDHGPNHRNAASPSIR